jgi:cyclic nucleotide gated channel
MLASHVRNASLNQKILAFFRLYYLLLSQNASYYCCVGHFAALHWLGIWSCRCWGHHCICCRSSVKATCWKSSCKHELSPIPCNPCYLDCDTLEFPDRKSWENTTVLPARCNPDDTSIFNYGIFANALQQKVLSSEFLEKYLYCLWWGLQNLRYDFIEIHHKYSFEIKSHAALANVFPIWRFLFSRRWMISYLMQYVSA